MKGRVVLISNLLVDECAKIYEGRSIVKQKPIKCETNF